MEKNKKITIEKVSHGYDVSFEGKTAQCLGYDEMLGLVSAIAMPEERPHLHWLKTPEQINKETEIFLSKYNDNE